MNAKIVLMAVLVLAVFVAGCEKSNSGYANYNQQAGQAPQGQYVGGGCGVAPSADYEDTPINAFGQGAQL